jgi:hypothetical protein
MNRGPLVMVGAVSAIFLAIVVLVGGAVALKVGPFARPPGTPTPFRSAVPSLVAVGSTEPTNSSEAPTTDQPTDSTAPATPTPRPTPRRSFANAYDELLSHVPERLRESCQETGFETPLRAATVCHTEDGAISVAYYTYSSADEMYVSYNELFHDAQIDADSGRCYEGGREETTATQNKWPAEHGYSIDDQPIGRYLCMDLSDGPGVIWTDDRFAILGIVKALDGGADRLVRYWLNEAGPI